MSAGRFAVRRSTSRYAREGSVPPEILMEDARHVAWTLGLRGMAVAVSIAWVKKAAPPSRDVGDRVKPGEEEEQAKKMLLGAILEVEQSVGSILEGAHLALGGHAVALYWLRQDESKITLRDGRCPSGLLALGPLPASDLDGNGSEADTLVVVTARGSDGWLLFADTDRDGSLLDERPVRDYLADGETFCWHAPGRPCPLGVGVNLREEDGVPVLDLVFDTSGHGSHVAGIAAGRDLYGVPGFHGVAPGATLLGLKIADNANGGISTTGAIRAAMAYAVRTARQRRLPLVINLSFGVGNEREGRARIDAVVDSILTANPDVVMTISAGNDGPGLSTLGFPGSADRAISVGATFPTVFVQRSARAASAPDPVAFL